uniref:Pentraxin 3 n=1 Tax=Tetraodon nigroviridis TaxID=99883 RepID=H3DMX1_TETNG
THFYQIQFASIFICFLLVFTQWWQHSNIACVNEISSTHATSSPAPCGSPDLSKWDKMFSMLENSQMRENMLLQYADDIIKLETRLRESLERLRLKEQNAAAARNSVGSSNHLEVTLQQLLSSVQTQANRLAKLEGIHEQQVTSRQADLDGLPDALLQVKVALAEVLRSWQQRNLPAGCEMALLFPMRSRRIYAAVASEVPLALSAFTVCMWVKPTVVSGKTVLLSYGDRRNPFEIQLLLGQTSALLTVGGEAHLVEARGVVKADGTSDWLHLCGTWSSDQGLASLWANGEKAVTTSGVAEGHVLADGGSLQLGQERNDCCPPTQRKENRVPGFEGGFDPKLAFVGKMTGVNVWSRVLSAAEISQLALREGRGCGQRGNVVAWGVTEMVPHGGAQFVH